MKFAILAAGEGSRLAQEGVELPKPLVKINGEAMIDRLIRIFNSCGAEEIVIITNNLTPLTQRHLRELMEAQSKAPLPPKGGDAIQQGGASIKLIVKTTPSSMHSFYELMPLLGEGKFCLTTVDTIFREEEFAQYIEAFKRFEGDGLMAVTDYIDDEKPLYITTKAPLCPPKRGETAVLPDITAFLDTCPNQEKQEGGLFISGGIYCLCDTAFPVLTRCIESGQSRMRNFQRQLIADGLKIKAYPFTKILDVDHASDIAKAEEFLGKVES